MPWLQYVIGIGVITVSTGTRIAAIAFHVLAAATTWTAVHWRVHLSTSRGQYQSEHPPLRLFENTF
eukprot:11073617-Karenia_brevis.AAC.1